MFLSQRGVEVVAAQSLLLSALCTVTVLSDIKMLLIGGGGS